MERTAASILEATLEVIIRSGLGAVRYRDVAAAAGVSLGTVSYQYPSREGLIRSTFEYFLAENAASLRMSAAAARVQTVEDLAALIGSIVRSECLDPKKRRLAEYELILAAARDPALARALDEWDRMLVAELGALAERVGCPTPFSMALSLHELVRGFQLKALSLSEPNFDDLEKRIARLLAACRAKPPESKRAQTAKPKRRKRT
jgi:TetR/AcrR family transcriptional regulator, regulator of biofilm formation and stress response